MAKAAGETRKEEGLDMKLIVVSFMAMRTRNEKSVGWEKNKYSLSFPFANLKRRKIRKKVVVTEMHGESLKQEK